ncbi:hypothetical protein FK949_gp311 [Paramecium bursaria Chlorella virus NYs1]|uniref:Uncharacterized protein n=1 Tax=Paramecium bursaria Chlorella virus NYs1 TaxID=83442 RepID=M1I8G6_9PHYC|nr:hypothetical protein AR158_C543L [Paramecium bursaria Chlorella virus AR158]YP_009665459.1 hypothetical protein FK949_gp311 [Paramecium bursaria Chlorella virus NYs1]AGE54313.1 hypothetical protein PBCVIL52s1_634L [Paramecium bursaria Chlorella virus IL-5-2s1]AGE54998.1 hypothetical protein PBCVMA1D_622L [Paramecium bursaria Chlorella virus MA1D]ABU44088.1 hypothetical protein AR158_C543L [Paramecium bursaria Chlorella virus AR158]AGE58814.1 hypothetical protein PBCVNYs1_627L [Paramecium bu
MAFSALYNEAVEVSNAAVAFDDLCEFDEMTSLVTNVQRAQTLLQEHILSLVESAVMEAASSGMKRAEIMSFTGAELFEGHSILFMLLGGADREFREKITDYGFEPLMDKLWNALKPFHVEHIWERVTNRNVIVLSWE